MTGWSVDLMKKKESSLSLPSAENKIFSCCSQGDRNPRSKGPVVSDDHRHTTTTMMMRDDWPAVSFRR